MRMRTLIVPLAGVAVLASCNLDLTNPNTASQQATFTTHDGIIALATGLQSRYGETMDNFAYPGGFITDEMGARTGALLSYRDAENGILFNTYDAVETSWQAHYRAIKTANDVIANAPGVALTDSTLSGIMSMAFLVKAMAYGQLVQQYQDAGVNLTTIGQPGTFVDRATAMDTVLALLDSAFARYQSVVPGSEFRTKVLAPGFDLLNTIYAMQARYHRLTNDWAGALAAAQQVNLGVVSQVPFSAQEINPIYNRSELAGYIYPRDTLRLEAEPGDQRVGFHIGGDTVPGNVRPLRHFAQYQSADAPIAVYYPAEIRLIIAEAAANASDLGTARNEINAVRTECGSGLHEPQPCLPALTDTDLPTQAAVIAQIYHERQISLFATGLRWEDARRLNSVGGPGAIAKRCWLIYPQSESSINPNTPADPEPSEPSATPESCGV